LTVNFSKRGSSILCDKGILPITCFLLFPYFAPFGRCNYKSVNGNSPLMTHNITFIWYVAPCSCVCTVLSFTQENLFDLYSYGRPGKTYSLCHKHKSLSLIDFLSTGRLMLDIWFIASLKSNTCSPYSYNNTQH
jgi:hypothetical protein